MIQQIPHVDHFKQQLQASLRQEARQCRAVQFAKHSNIYTCGEQDETIYFIESGQIKLLMLSPEGNECLLAILTAGDIFGELCLSGLRERGNGNGHAKDSRQVDSLHPVLWAAQPRCIARRLHPIPGRAHWRPTSSDRQPSDGR